MYRCAFFLIDAFDLEHQGRRQESLHEAGKVDGAIWVIFCIHHADLYPYNRYNTFPRSLLFREAKFGSDQSRWDNGLIRVQYEYKYHRKSLDPFQAILDCRGRCNPLPFWHRPRNLQYLCTKHHGIDAKITLDVTNTDRYDKEARYLRRRTTASPASAEKPTHISSWEGNMNLESN